MIPFRPAHLLVPLAGAMVLLGSSLEAASSAECYTPFPASGLSISSPSAVPGQTVTLTWCAPDFVPPPNCADCPSFETKSYRLGRSTIPSGPFQPVAEVFPPKTTSAFQAGPAEAGLTDYFQLVALGTTGSLIGPQPTSVTSNTVALRVGSSSGCQSDETTFCLFDRFQVRAAFRRYGSSTLETARARSYSATTGFFSTAVDEDVDVVVKMVDFCSLASAWSVYLGGTTDLEVRVTIVDTRTQASRDFVNALGDPWLLRREAAFACP